MFGAVQQKLRFITIDKGTDPGSKSFYFVGYPYRCKGYRFYYPFRSIKVVESINAKFFKDGHFSGNTVVRDILFEEEGHTISVLIY